MLVGLLSMIDEPDDRPSIVAPELQPPAEPPSQRRVYLGIACLLLGFTAIFFGGSDGVDLGLAIGGSMLVFVSLFVFHAFRLDARHQRYDRDIRKLYRHP